MTSACGFPQPWQQAEAAGGHSSGVPRHDAVPSVGAFNVGRPQLVSQPGHPRCEQGGPQCRRGSANLGSFQWCLLSIGLLVVPRTFLSVFASPLFFSFVWFWFQREFDFFYFVLRFISTEFLRVQICPRTPTPVWRGVLLTLFLGGNGLPCIHCTLTALARLLGAV